MKQKRLTHKEKTELFAKYETGKYTGSDLAKQYNISSVAVNALLRRHGYNAKSQSELQRKYKINETFFDTIDTEEKAYFLGFLYADGCNDTDRNSVTLTETGNYLRNPTKDTFGFHSREFCKKYGIPDKHYHKTDKT